MALRFVSTKDEAWPPPTGGSVVIFGLSTDEKPTATNGVSFIEEDTGLHFTVVSNVWEQTTASQGGGADWPDITNKPTTVAGYGITDAATDAELAAHEGDTTNVHGIANTANLVLTNDARLSDARTPTSHTHPWAQVTGPPTTLVGYGITDFALFSLASDVSTGANTTPVNLTGLVFSFLANSTYIIDLFMMQQSALATTGFGYQLDTSVAVTNVVCGHWSQLANVGTLTGSSSIGDALSTGVASGLPTNATIVPAFGSALLRSAGNAGTAQLRVWSEVAAVTTCKAGSTIRVMKAG